MKKHSQTRTAAGASARSLSSLYHNRRGAGAIIQMVLHRAYDPDPKRVFSKASTVFCLSMLLALLLSSGALAFGVTPARAQTTWVPNSVSTGSFRIINNDNFNGSAGISIDSELAGWVHINQTIVPLQDIVSIPYSISFPREAPPAGDYQVRIYAEPLLSQDANAVGAHVRIAHTVTIHVPVHGKAFVVSLDVVEDRSNVSFKARVKNVGTERIGEFTSLFELSDAVEDATVLVSSTAVAPGLDVGDEENITTVLPLDALPTGAYDVNVLLSSDGKSVGTEGRWLNGEPTLLLTQIPKFVKAGSVNSYAFTVFNDWNQAFDDVDGEIEIRNKQNETVSTFVTERVRLSPRTNVTFVPALDATRLSAGKYDVLLRVNLAGHTQQYGYELDVLNEQSYVARIEAQEHPERTAFRAVIMVALLLLLAIASIAIYLYYRPPEEPPAMRKKVNPKR